MLPISFGNCVDQPRQENPLGPFCGQLYDLRALDRLGAQHALGEFDRIRAQIGKTAAGSQPIDDILQQGAAG